ncbi:MAG TPA: rRNA maturation RNase YbeY [Chitinophagaceae bacterium]|nr:rRNA maturation RNase YbeY [Chitinophagaceae bacterium]
MQKKNSIECFNEHPHLTLEKEHELISFLEQDLINLKQWDTFNIRIIFLTDDALLKINQEFLKHDYYTDIITFDLSTSPEDLDSDIYISLDRVQENAVTFKTDYQQELLRVIFHGILHLQGFKDETEEEQQIMREEEESLIKLFKKYLNAH